LSATAFPRQSFAQNKSLACHQRDKIELFLKSIPSEIFNMDASYVKHILKIVTSISLPFFKGSVRNFAQLPNHSLFKVKRPAQDVLAISVPQLPPKRMRTEKNAGNPECEGSRAKRCCKNPCDDCNRVDCDARDSI
jgi:hypothetical protein